MRARQLKLAELRAAEMVARTRYVEARDKVAAAAIAWDARIGVGRLEDEALLELRSAVRTYWEAHGVFVTAAAAVEQRAQKSARRRSA